MSINSISERVADINYLQMGIFDLFWEYDGVAVNVDYFCTRIESNRFMT